VGAWCIGRQSARGAGRPGGRAAGRPVCRNPPRRQNSPVPTPLDTYQTEPPRLFRAACRMLGSTREAEDVLRATLLRWEAAPRPEIAEPAGYLRRIVARLALEQLRSAHARRVEYVGPWLPEPILGDLPGADDPAARDEDLSTAFLLLLERL